MNCEHEFIGKSTLKQTIEEVVEQIIKYKQLQGLYSPPQYLESKKGEGVKREA